MWYVYIFVNDLVMCHIENVDEIFVASVLRFLCVKEHHKLSGFYAEESGLKIWI